MVVLSEPARHVWGKTSKTSPQSQWLPLWRHLADSAAMAGRLWDGWVSPAGTCQVK
jgi:hypothetical protein